MAFNNTLASETSRPKGTNKYLTKFDEDVIIRFIDGPYFCYKDLAFEKQADGTNKKVVEDYWFETNPKTGERIKEPRNLARPDILDNLTKKKRRARYFWSTMVWNVNEQCIQYFEIDKNQIIDAIVKLTKDYDLNETDIKISKEGKGTDTKYHVIPVSPKNQSDLPANIDELKADAGYDLLNLGDPFGSKDNQVVTNQEMNQAAEAVANTDIDDLVAGVPF